VIARRVSLAVALIVALAGGGNAFAATHHASHHARTLHMARYTATGSSSSCPNMGGSSSSASTAA
jgi:hypothetical protein